VAKKRGLFEVADGGTIFLDEIGDMQLPAQAKVLRVLQTGEFTRVGGEKSLRTDSRVVAATNRDLEQMVKDGDLPRGPVLPPQRRADPVAELRERARRRAAPGRELRRASAATRTASPTSRSTTSSSPGSSATTGRATCASCATWSSAWSS
jgi:two-component system NtrC family response regulator